MSDSDSEVEKYNEAVLNEFQNTDSEESDDDENPVQKNPEVPVELNEKLEQIKKERQDDQPKTIFVGNLVKTVKKKHLEKLFMDHGKIKSIRLRTDTGKQFKAIKELKYVTSLNAYVVFAEESEAKAACTLNGFLFKGQHIRVNLATKTKEKQEKNDSKSVLFIGNLKYSATEEKLYDIFQTCGEIDYVRTLKNERGCKGIAYVSFKRADSVQLGLELNGTMLDDRPIRVERYSTNWKEKQQKLNQRREVFSQKMNQKKKHKGKEKKNKPTIGAGQNFSKIEAGKSTASGEEGKNKKSKAQKFYEGKKVARTKKKNKLGKGMKMKKNLAKKIAPKS